MTREEARLYLIQHCNPCYPNGQTEWDRAINMAIKALEEPERKKGRWIEMHGFCTPGGDPVWKCSECGKGIHVCGVETYRTDISDGQWKACPGCGAEMIKD